jgi:ATPase subunit of ABC transporter with duplicated ATPase domains
VTIVGENGCGKTTFLHLLSGVDYPYSGSIIIEGRIGFLPQHFEEVDSNEVAIVTLLKSLHDPNINQFLEQSYEPFSSEWYQELNSLGGHEIFRQANLIGLANNLLEKPFKYLSGGEKTKTMLCALSILEPDIILLDEPTNHLDMQGIEWLENFLRKYDGGVIMVTHDRSLINAVSNRISELSPHTKKFVHFKGGYKNYLAEEEKRRQRAIQERQHQEKELKILKQKSIQQKEKIKGRIIRAGHDRDKISFNNKEKRAQKGCTKAFNQFSDRLEHLTGNLVDIIPERTQISFDFNDNPTSSSSFLTLDVSHIAKSYKDPLFHNISFTLGKGDRLIIQGPNGAGKSTIMQIIMNLTQADEGSVTISNNAVIGYLDQEQENIPLDKSAVTLLKEDPLINASDQEAIKNLRHFGIYTWHDLKSPLKTLSIGCRRKAQLCQIIMRKSSILLLDEPTNHIDFPSLEAIEEALLSFPGIIIAATHDRYFTEKVGMKTLNLSDFKPTSN